ncbi:MAG TPA: nucleoside monophosphate kinase [Ktedonobacterales bacterium]|jgi:adenylate kinase|nr:nucleoside monophosphate kinase [Ktedonobacterales bacterium]
MNLILIGAQGSGKGTQAQLLAEELRLKPCASGDLLRDAIALQTPAGRAAKPYYDRGDLVPDDIVADMILDNLQQLGDAKGIILDGFPRTQRQAELLDRRLGEMGAHIDHALYLAVPRDVLQDRLSGRVVCAAHGHVWNLKTHPPRVPGVCDLDGSPLSQRSDDTPAKIKHRLDIFFGETIHLTEYYRRQNKLVQVNGNDSVEVVHAQIRARLGVERAPAPVQNEQSAANG